MGESTISPRRLAELAAGNHEIDLVDVRTPAEYREVHVAAARNVPLDRLNPATVLRDRRGDEPIYVICRSGGRGRQACEKFNAAGFANVANVEGGTQAWVECGLPVVRGQRVISLERQVRITAGSLVLLGLLLGWFVHPVFLALSAFVGAGLVFSGISDTCGLGLLLARMPWNQSSAPAEQCCATTESRT
jgi:rhodanese-related sulfurtransferase